MNGITDLSKVRERDDYDLTTAREFSIATALEEKLFKKKIQVDVSQIRTALSQMPITQETDKDKILKYNDSESYNKKILILRDIENDCPLTNKTKALWKV